MLLYSENPCHLAFTGGIIIMYDRHFLVIVIYTSVIIIENSTARTAGNMTEKQVHFFQVGDLWCTPEFRCFHRIKQSSTNLFLPVLNRAAYIST